MTGRGVPQPSGAPVTFSRRGSQIQNNLCSLCRWPPASRTPSSDAAAPHHYATDNHQSWIHQISGVNSDSDEDDVVDQIGTLGVFQRCLRHECRTAAGDVHRRPRLLEAGAGRVWSEWVLDVSTIVSLIEQRQSDALTERPRQQVIVIALQDINYTKIIIGLN